MANWSELSFAPTFAGGGILWDGTRYILFGSGSSSNIVKTSTDGVTWVSNTVPSTGATDNLVWSGSLYVASGNGANGTGTYLTSPDAATWTARTGPSDNMFF